MFGPFFGNVEMKCLNLVIGDNITYTMCGRYAGWPWLGKVKSRGVAGEAQCSSGQNFPLNLASK